MQEITGDLPIVSSNDKFLTKFHSGTLRIIDTMILMSVFELLLEHLLEFVLNSCQIISIQRRIYMNFTSTGYNMQVRNVKLCFVSIHTHFSSSFHSLIVCPGLPNNRSIEYLPSNTFAASSIVLQRFVKVSC